MAKSTPAAKKEAEKSFDIKIKKEFKNKVVAFNNNGKPLGERDDLDILAIMAHESQNPNLLNLFDGELPSLKDLKKKKTDAELEQIPVGDPNTQNPGFTASDAETK